jgi:hypothetical protein
MFLNSPYSSDSKINSTYTLIINYTENYGFLYLAENSLSAAAVYNEMITALDRKLKSMEEKISKLENQR